MKKLIIILICCVLCCASCTAVLFAAIHTDYYETTDPADYRKIVGNNNNEVPAEFIASFFPEEIIPDFSDVTYSYRAENGDTYGYEAYLEFTVTDPEAFQNYVSQIAPPDNWQEFRFDSGYMEYVVSDVFEIHSVKSESTGSGLPVCAIQAAQIGKVLYSAEQSRIIYVALGVYDGGGVNTSFLCRFFERFHIDPTEYEKFADSPYVND